MKFHHSIEWWNELCSKTTRSMVEFQVSKTTVCMTYFHTCHPSVMVWKSKISNPLKIYNFKRVVFDGFEKAKKTVFEPIVVVGVFNIIKAVGGFS